MASELLTVDEAADRLRLKKSYIYKLKCQGRLPSVKPTGGKLLFESDALDAFIKRGRISADYELADAAIATLNQGHHR